MSYELYGRSGNGKSNLKRPCYQYKSNQYLVQWGNEQQQQQQQQSNHNKATTEKQPQQSNRSKVAATKNMRKEKKRQIQIASFP